MERTEEQIQADEIRHQKKQDQLDKMIAKQMIRAQRMERINPTGFVSPLTVEEIETIEKELPVGDFTDADILDAVTRKIPQKKVQVEKTINDRKKPK